MFANASKPFASLSSGLLARKGQARPAMRPQGYASLSGMGASPLEDLGWNDMGGAVEAQPAAMPAQAPEPAPVEPIADTVELPAEPVPVPSVLTERQALGDALAEVAETEELRAERSVSVATATRLARESAQQTKKAGKAAFTLRLDADRHLRLRLASALAGRSAQLLVTRAVDDLLKSLPEVELLIGQLPPAKKNGR